MNIFNNTIKVAIRNLLKNKLQSAILLGGLTVGMTACIMLLSYVSFEISFDDFHQKKDNIYRIVNERFQNGTPVQKGTITYPRVGYAIKEEFPEVKNSTRIAYSTDVMVNYDNQIKPVEPGLWVDEHFFEIFDFKMLAQSKPSLLNETNEIILTQQLADYYFPSIKGNYELAINQEFKIDRYPDVFKVVGVMEDVPANSSLDFQLLLSYASCIRYWGEGADNSWTWSDFYHYVELEENTDVAALETKLEGFSERRFKGSEVSGSKEVFTLQPLADMHLHSQGLEYEIAKTNNGRAVWALGLIALFILLIAWINYINLSSVRAMERAKEVGVRKVLGATHRQLFTQFISEAAIINLMSLGLAIGITFLISPWLENYFVTESIFEFSSSKAYLFSGLLGLIALGVFISGAYPAYLLTAPQVSSVLKNIFHKDLGGARLRKALVVFQFIISIALIAVTWVVSDQIRYMTQEDLGLNIDQIITINSPELTEWDSTFINRMNTFKTELTKFSDIESACTSSRTTGERMGRLFDIQKMGEQEGDQLFTSNAFYVDFEFAKTYGMDLKAGRFFRENDHHNNWDFVDKIVINEATVNMLGYDNNETAIGNKIRFGEKEWSIIGVAPDFHQRSLHHAIEPIVFVPSYSTNNLLSVHVNSKNIEHTIANIETTYQRFFPGNTFYYNFLDEQFHQLYEADLRFRDILSFFTFLAIFIACLGLLGLVSYTTFLRTKEIGIRKILGASVFGIVGLLSKDFMRLIIIALIVAIPFSWYFINNWLGNYAYRIAIDWKVFLIAGIAAIGIALTTIGIQSLRAALSNPVNSIKNE